MEKNNLIYNEGYKQLSAFKNIYKIEVKNNVKYWLWSLIGLAFLSLFLPWTQNIRSKGTVTTLRQEHRPQELHAIISGKVEKWFVKEGDFVKKGDTILELGEVKVDYFDPKLLERTKKQIESKQQSIEGYKNKAKTTETQTKALAKALDLKLKSVENKITQQYLKVQTDLADLQAQNKELEVYKRQIAAAKVMLDSGAISLTEFEKRKVNYQNGLAKVNGTNNKLLHDKQELNNLQLEQHTAIQEYADKIAKVQGDRFSALINSCKYRCGSS